MESITTKQRAVPLKYNDTWFLPHEEAWNREVFPFLKAWAAAYGTVDILEIGCYEGLSSTWLIEHAIEAVRFAGRPYNAAQLTCVDPWFSPDFDTIRSHFEHNIRATGFPDRVRVFRDKSENVLPQLESASFCLVYVDGCHFAQEVYLDTLQAVRLVAPGGMVLFDDCDPQGTTPGEELVQVQMGLSRALPELGIDLKKLPWVGHHLRYDRPRAVVVPQ